MDLKKAMSWSNKAGKAMMLREAKETGKPLAEVVAEHSGPVLAVLNEDLKFEYNGNLITVDEFERINPLGKYAKLVILGTEDIMEKLHQES